MIIYVKGCRRDKIGTYYIIMIPIRSTLPDFRAVWEYFTLIIGSLRFTNYVCERITAGFKSVVYQGCTDLYNNFYDDS